MTQRSSSSSSEKSGDAPAAGNACEQRGDLAGAVAAYRKALRRDAASLPALESLCRVLIASQQYVTAIPHVEDLARLAPRHFLPHAWLGQAYLGCDRWGEAERAYARAAELNPSLPLIDVERGRIAALRGDLESACATLESVLAAGELDVSTRLAACHLLYQAGGREPALAEYRRVVSRQPDQARAWCNLALKAPGQVEEFEWERIEELSARDGVSAKDAAGLHYALVQRARRVGDAEAVRKHAARANQLLASVLPDSTALHRSYHEQLLRVFNREYFDGRRGAHGAHAACRPIFIVGLPRSGTTLVEQILASHSTVFGGGELRLIAASLEEVGRDYGGRPLDALAGLPTEAVSASAEQVMRRYAEIGRGHSFVTDKLPENYLHLGWIATLFQAPLVIHVRRDPRDVALSLWTTRLAELDWSCDLDRIADHIERHAELSEQWRRTLPIEVLDVRYEELVRDPGAQSRRLLTHCGLPWEPACASPHETRRAVDTASTDQVARPIHTSSVGQWEAYRPVLGPILERLEALCVGNSYCAKGCAVRG